MAGIDQFRGALLGGACGDALGLSLIHIYGDTNPASLRSSAPSRGRGENDSKSGIALYIN